MSDTLLRQWELLRCIPRAPRRVNVATLMDRLRAAGYRITQRSLQRDLNLLSSIFPLQSDTRTIPYGWSWAAGAPAFDLPSMDGPTALTLRIVEQFSRTLLPPTVLETLAPHFARAKAVLDANPENPLGAWVDCVRIVPREMPLLPPKVNEDAVRAVYQGLLDGRRLKLRYTPRSEGEREYEVNPLGLVVRGSLSYLVCTLWNYEDVKQLALHRIGSAEAIDMPADRPPGFDLDQYIAAGEFQYQTGPLIRLKAKFDRGAAAHLYETPLSEDQTIEEIDPAHILVTATVRDTLQLEWWLLGFAELAEAVEPADLRSRLRARTIAGRRLYARQGIFST